MTIMSLRTAARRLTVSCKNAQPRSLLARCMATTSKELTEIKAEEENNEAREALEAEKSSVQKYVERTRELDQHMVWGTTVAPPAPVLPDDESEITFLDPAHTNQDPLDLSTGETRVVTIKQEEANPMQAPTNVEKQWHISFQDEGELAHAWDNPLMGWVSSSDSLANSSRLQMYFKTAADAVYFAKKRGYKYTIEEPILRKGRSDDAQYQDNFLPQNVSLRVRQEGHKCDEWSREEAGASHYFRPLKYHGDGTVPQHGPNGDEETVPDVEGYYKLR